MHTDHERVFWALAEGYHRPIKLTITEQSCVYKTALFNMYSCTEWNYICRSDGCFVARTIGKNSTEIVVLDVLTIMWKNYKDRIKQEGNHYTKDEESYDA